MLFNSLEFVFFLPIVFLLYWFIFNKKLSIQNGLLLVASYFFTAGGVGNLWACLWRVIF
jgi:alginate O-acetyltransferase complex protein AlgI